MYFIEIAFTNVETSCTVSKYQISINYDLYSICIFVNIATMKLKVFNIVKRTICKRNVEYSKEEIYI